MKLLKKLGFLSAFLLPLGLLKSYYLGGYWNFSTVLFVYGVFPLLDFWAGSDPQNPDEAQVTALSEARYFRFVTYAWVFVQVGMVIWGASVFALGTLTFWPAVGFLLGMATVTGGIGITVAHELGHRAEPIERFYCQVLLLTVCYMHFYIEHNQGHHVHVATPRDPATSRKNETFYAFWFRTVTGSWRSAWRLETARLHKKGQATWSIHNRMVWYAVLPLLFCAALTAGLSGYAGHWLWRVPVFFFTQSLLAFSLLELVNYIEHYGIVRRQVATGRYERVNALHSWNANPLLSNFYLFQLQRHADHHAHANRRYQVLRHVEESPQLPAGYPAMILVALLPPLWFRLMNLRLEAWQRQHVTSDEAPVNSKANLRI
ncbi:MAG: alkane 1-monooxygenase [Cytophagaceae bacterium]|nr:alkane 1-monooxygenase [Cytophagaceae bacterium]